MAEAPSCLGSIQVIRPRTALWDDAVINGVRPKEFAFRFIKTVECYLNFWTLFPGFVGGWKGRRRPIEIKYFTNCRDLIQWAFTRRRTSHRVGKKMRQAI